MKNEIAFFDFDGTITHNDTFLDFIVFTRGRYVFYLFLLILFPFVFLYLIRVYPNYKLKEKFFQKFLSKFSSSELNMLGKEYSKHQLDKHVYKQALERIKWHQTNGHRIVILTASSTIWLSYWCKKNNLEIIGTNYEVKDDKYTGKIVGKNCYGKEKYRIVKQILSENNYDVTYGYGDSKSDLQYLDLLDNKYYKFFKK